ncbi:hypothetical protein PTKIN_Ptkin16aG0092700 [Pterospermum kingtungense]
MFHSPNSQCFSFLQNHAAIIPLAVRYVSKIAASNEHSFTVSYLINSCGFSPESALSVSKAVQVETPQKPDSVISFFKNHGFSQTQIRSVIKKHPKFLLCNPEKALLPKFQFFHSKRISSSDLTRILSANPEILRRCLDNCIIPNFNSFKDFAHCDDIKVFQAYKNSSDILVRDFRSFVAPNLAILNDYGVPESIVMSELVVHPRAFAVKSDRFRIAVEDVKKLGLNPSKHNFLVALKALLQVSNSARERKFDVLKQWGWSHEDIVSAFEKFPRLMMFSEHKITATMDFFVNTMGLKSSDIAKRPLFLSFSLERRIIPRCSVIQALLSKGLIEKFSINCVLVCNEKEFLLKYVFPYEDPYILKLYEEKLEHSK